MHDLAQAKGITLKEGKQEQEEFSRSRRENMRVRKELIIFKKRRLIQPLIFVAQLFTEVKNNDLH